MARIRLYKPWTDAEGVSHRAGDTVDVDDATLAELRKAGLVADDREADNDGSGIRQGDWAGPSADINDTDRY